MTRFSPGDAAALDRLLTWRRDVRQFRPEPIDEAIVAELALAMDHAPSVGNSRPWRVIRVESPEIRQPIKTEFTRCNAAAANLYTGAQSDEYRRLVLAGLDIAPLQLAVFTAIDPAAGHGLGRQTMPETLAQSTAMAIHTLWLAARVRNIGLGMVSILDPQAVQRICAVPPDWQFCAYLCIGHAAAEDDQPLLHRIGWQENTSNEWERR